MTQLINLSDSIVNCLGTLGSVAILISMCFKTTTIRGEKWMRILNLMGSIIYVFYGMCLKNGISVIVLNFILTLVNLYYLQKCLKHGY